MENEQKMREPIGPNDTAEAYAPYYLLPPDDVELFEQVKKLHDYCQNKNIPMAILGQFPVSRMECCFFHFNNEKPDNSAALERLIARTELLFATIANFLKRASQGRLKITREY